MNILYNIVIYPIEMVFDAIFYYLRFYPGVAIIAISVVMNLLALPLYRRADSIQEEESRKSASMAKWVTHIKKTFKGDERYMMLTEYYRQQNYRPIYSLRSIFPLLLQIPFFIAAYHYLSHQPMLSGTSFAFLKDLGAPDGLIRIGSVSVNVLPVVMTALNVVSAYIYLRGAPLTNKIQTYGIAAVFLVLLYNSPSGLVFYWTLNQIFSVVKNIFMKLIKKQRTRNIIIAAAGTVVAAVSVIAGLVNTKVRLLIICVILVAAYLPALSSLIEKCRRPKSVRELKHSTFILGSVFLTLLAGAVIPLSVINSDPSAFISVVTSSSELIVHNVSVFAGIFIFWMGIYYFLMDRAAKSAFTAAVWLLSAAALVDYLFFPGSYGVMSNSFVFDNMPVFPRSEVLVNLAVLVLIIIVLYLLIKKWEKPVVYAYLILIIACVCMSGVYISHISKTTAVTQDVQSTAASEDTLRLSRKGKNVLVFVTDKAMGSYLPFILDEKPELAEQFSGFTAYPSAMSYAIVTKWAAPALYGGYEYSPFRLNERADEPLADKHDEALSVLPAIFSDSGYNVTVWNPALAGYDIRQRATVLYDFDPNIRSFELDESRYLETYARYGASMLNYKQKNLVFYCIFRMVPVIGRASVYQHGDYLHTTQILYSDDFLRYYCELAALPEITAASDNETGNFLMLYNALPHNPTFLEAPDYVPEENAVSSALSADEDRYLGGRCLKMDTASRKKYYASNMASCILLGRWCEHLKELGVYDNTRIIIASDHGATLNGQLDSSMLNPSVDLEALNCLVMVKDFGSTGALTLDSSVIMNAAVPSLAVSGTVDDSVNPFTGSDIRSFSDDVGRTLAYVDDTALSLTEMVLDTSNGFVLGFDGDEFYDLDNWTVIQEQLR